MSNGTDQLPPLAQRVLADHRRAPAAMFYDLFALGSFIDLRQLAVLDAAYDVLERHGHVQRVDGGMVEIGGHIRPMFRLTSSGVGEIAA